MDVGPLLLPALVGLLFPFAPSGKGNLRWLFHWWFLACIVFYAFGAREGKKSAAWQAIKKRATEQAQNAALVELGIPPGSLNPTLQREAIVSVLPEQDDEPRVDDPSVSTEPEDVAPAEAPDVETAGDGTDIEEASTGNRTGIADSDTLRTLEFVVSPGAPNAPPVVLTERKQIPQKWVRLPIDFGVLRIDLSLTDDAIDRTVAAFNTAMKQRIEDAINAWAADPDPEVGGLLWGFPAGSGSHSQRVTPTDVVTWGQTLAALRINRTIARPDIEPVVEF
jgi:hypothetical protein